MYLALLPDAESLAALKRFAPSVLDDAHLTIIHSKANPRPYSSGLCVAEPLALPTWAGSLTLSTKSVASFGGRNKIPVLTLDLTAELRAMREQAEGILRKAGLPWSTGWPFAPHVALGLGLMKLTGCPATLRFDRMEWR
jgi:hypothetical protein